MLGAFSQKLAQSGQTAGVIISVALMLFLGFAMTRITKALRLPDVTAYLARAAEPGDIILTVGAGDIYRAGLALLQQ